MRERLIHGHYMLGRIIPVACIGETGGIFIMDREENVSRTLYKSYVIDDGWHLPQEVVEAIDLRVQAAYEDAYRDVCREHDRHRGAWLTAEAVRSFFARSWVWRVIYEGQYIGMVREIGEELRREYGVTELEAINIMNGNNVEDYLNKYHRIQNRIPVNVNAQAICDELIFEYLELAM